MSVSIALIPLRRRRFSRCAFLRVSGPLYLKCRDALGLHLGMLTRCGLAG